MKKVNPFNRVKKENVVPYSVFPAHKTVRTSMRIGELVPVYQLEMVQGNHVEIGVSQLTRFMTMDRPVMNDFEVNFGAFFVPFRSFDRLGGHGIRTADMLSDRKYSASTDYIASSALDYQTYFNPATPDSWRVNHFPIHFDIRNITPCPLIGSIWEHLGYAMPLGLLAEGLYYSAVKYVSPNPVVLNGPSKSFSDIVFTDTVSPVDSLGMTPPTMPNETWIMCQDSITSTKKFYIVPMQVWFGLRFANLSTADSSLVSCLFSANINDSVNSSVRALLNLTDASSWNDVNLLDRMSYVAALNSFYDLIHGTKTIEQVTNGQCKTIDQLLSAYRNDISYGICLPLGFGAPYQSRRQNCIPLLAYLRLYGDYFLHPNYENKDIWFEIIGAKYLENCSDPTLRLDRNIIDYIDEYSTSGSHMYLDALKKGRPLPVMWQTDPFTAILPADVDSGQSISIEDGDSIPTLFYKRMLFKFKNLIARMGNDYKQNVEQLYGSNVSLTCDSSQLVGIRKFTLSMGAIGQTAPSADSTSEVGQFAGYAYSNDRAGGFSWTAEENGVFMVCAWVRPRGIAYSDSVNKLSLKSLYSDFLNPMLGGVGYEDVRGYEIAGSTASNILVGKRERYFDYMMLNNEVSGAFRTIARPYSVDRDINSIPTLNTVKGAPIEFFYITDKDDVHRIFTDRINDPILAQIHFEGSVTRQLPATIRLDF